MRAFGRPVQRAAQRYRIVPGQAQPLRQHEDISGRRHIPEGQAAVANPPAPSVLDALVGDTRIRKPLRVGRLLRDSDLAGVLVDKAVLKAQTGGDAVQSRLHAIRNA